MEAILKAEHIHKEYGELTVLKDVDLSVSKGEVIVVIGPSGCGKSTFLRCLNGLEEIQGGSVSLHGEVINSSEKGAGSKLYESRRKIGMVFQSYDLFPHKTILHNVTLAPIKVAKREKTEVEKEAVYLLSRVGLEEKKDCYPRQLSGGQKQRVAIVRALIMQPEVLLLDEITAALDPEMVREVLDVVLDLAKEGRTMIIVTHELKFAEAVADRIVFMDEGVIVEEGTAEEFFSAPKTARAKSFLESFEYK